MTCQNANDDCSILFNYICLSKYAVNRRSSYTVPFLQVYMLHADSLCSLMRYLWCFFSAQFHPQQLYNCLKYGSRVEISYTDLSELFRSDGYVYTGDLSFEITSGYDCLPSKLFSRSGLELIRWLVFYSVFKNR